MPGNQFFDVTDPGWWIGVVIVSLGLNIVAEYLKPRIDSLLSRISNRQRRNSENRRRQFEERVQILIEDSEERDILRWRILLVKTMITDILIISVTLYLVYQSIEAGNIIPFEELTVESKILTLVMFVPIIMLLVFVKDIFTEFKVLNQVDADRDLE